MNKAFSYILLIAAVTIVLDSCAKVDTSEGTNVAEGRIFDSWMKVHYPDSVSIAHGIYVMNDIPGTGEELKEENYIYVHYEIRRLSDGYLTEYTRDSSAIKRNEYNIANDYSPGVYRYMRKVSSAGILDMFSGGKSADGSRSYPKMKIGGTRTAIVPGWLTSATVFYGTEAAFRAAVTGTNSLYTITAIAQTDDIVKYQIDSIIKVGKTPRKWITLHHGNFVPFLDRSVEWNAADSLRGHGGNLFFKRDEQREKQRGVHDKVKMNRKIPSDSTIYINYTGRLLNGKVFDTTIADTATQYGIYSPSASYKPVSVTFSNDSTKLTMSSSSIIKGFSLTLWHMHPYESARGIFTSEYGYEKAGSKPRIGQYAPLIFDIDVVDQP